MPTKYEMAKKLPQPSRAKLNVFEQDELHRWLKSHKIKYMRLRRDFTDVFPTACLLAQHYPDKVDPNYFLPRNSIQSKVSNWLLFNERVLRRLGVHVTRHDIELIARCTPGIVDTLLYRIMHLHNCKNCFDILPNTDTNEDKPKIGRRMSEGTNIELSTRRRLPAGGKKYADVFVVQMRNNLKAKARNMVSCTSYASALRRMQKKSVRIKLFKQKVAHLENMSLLKDELINELKKKIQRFVRMPTPPPPPPAAIIDMSRRIPKPRALQSGQFDNNFASKYGRNSVMMQRPARVVAAQNRRKPCPFFHKKNNESSTSAKHNRKCK